MTKLGGIYNKGVLFAYDTLLGSYEIKLNFSDSEGTFPTGSLIEPVTGKLYGMTSDGGAGSVGVIFEYDISTGIYTKKFDFWGLVNGAAPLGSLFKASNGKLYGMTSSGGINNAGVLFEYDFAASSFNKLYDLSNSDGTFPHGDLMQASNGKLYGLATNGGAFNYGTLFEYNLATNQFLKLNDFFQFGTNNTGGMPIGSLIQSANGKLYGLASSGGVNNNGVLFEYDYIQYSYNIKVSFGGVYGGSPFGSLVADSSGTMYGYTASLYGTIFSYQPGNTSINILKTFSINSGKQPHGSPLLCSNGKIYGMTNQGGQSNKGVLFEFTLSNPNLYSEKVEFLSATQGKSPMGSLMKASNGLLYGLTSSGGAYNMGTLFEYNPFTNVYTKKIDFSGGANGSLPYGGLLEASNGMLYGMTRTGGSNNYGVLFEYNPFNNNINLKHNFQFNTGSYPNGSLIELNGKLYGMTSDGGTGNGAKGVLFMYDYNQNLYTLKNIFTYYNTGPGGVPLGTLLNTGNGKLHGLTSDYGQNYDGTLFVFDTTSASLTRKTSFNVTLGRNAYGDLILANNGKLYGFTSVGGISSLNGGTIIEYDILNDTCLRKFTFLANNPLLGNGPRGSFLAASNGKLYGMTWTGGSYNMGILFEYIPGDSSITKKFDFNGTYGAKPFYTHLNEVSLCANVSVTQNLSVFTAGAINASFQWIDCSTMSPIPGETNQSFSATANGSYAVVVTQNGCTDTSSCYSINNLGLNISQLADGIFEILPAISSRKYIAKFPFSKHGMLRVSDSNGKNVYNIMLAPETNSIELDLTFLRCGSYICTYTDDEHTSYKKMVIAR